MTVKEINKVIKKYTTPETEEPEEATPETEETTPEMEIVLSMTAYIKDSNRILEINGQPMKTPEDVAKAIQTLNAFLNGK